MERTRSTAPFKKKGRRVFHAITGFAKYRIYEADGNAMKLLAIG
ncbi:MAG: hypothetical protein QXR50_07505 [Archaeoglobaceae archaeon]